MSLKSFHRNKGATLGHVIEIEEIKDTIEESLSQFINLIQATLEIINLRMSESDIKNFNLSHFSSTQKEKFILKI